MRAKQDKYIDLNQFPHNAKGTISWRDSIGVVAEFFYNGERHEVEVLEYVNKSCLKIRVDNVVIENVHTTKIINLNFYHIFHKPNYIYDVGDIVNDLLVIEQCRKKQKSASSPLKAYKVMCLKDNYEFVISEYDLKYGHGCPVCAGKIVVKGINDVAITDPDLIKFFVFIEDAYKHTRCADCEVLVRCPNCGIQKYMRMATLTSLRYVTCNKCSDGLSYPNKFAHELFRQLSSQYDLYEYEYSPEWAKPYFYDNYIELCNGEKIIVEMDGGYHYRNDEHRYNNDCIKNELCAMNDISMVRIDCNYKNISERFSYIKPNIEKELGNYFDLSYVDWNRCNEAGNSNCLKDAIDYYNRNPESHLNDIASHFNIDTATLYRYLKIGEESGLCEYVRKDPNRVKITKPVAMYDIDDNLIGIFKSTKSIIESFPEKCFYYGSIRRSIAADKPYKGYIFKNATYEEYQANKLLV